MLSETLESLRQVRAALRRGDLAGLKRSLGQQADTARAAHQLQARRARLRDEMASALGVPARCVTLRWLADRLPVPLAQCFEQRRQRLHQMTLQVGRLGRDNADLVRQSVMLLHQLLIELAGTEDTFWDAQPGLSARA